MKAAPTSGLPSMNLEDYTLALSPQGVSELITNFDPKNPERNVVWTTDPRVELPILMTRTGPASISAITTMDLWAEVLKKHGNSPALSDKIGGQWQTISYNEYYDLVIKFALGLIRLGITPRSAVSILGFNCSAWYIDFFGAIFANCIACGHYLTNAPDAIQYVIEHSDTELMVVENQEQLDKVLQIWDKTPKLK